MSSDDRGGDDSVFEFPCEFPIKVICKNLENISELILQVSQKHAPDLTRDNLSTALSHSDKYISVTVTLNARSREQLDSIYVELNQLEETIMLL